MNNCSFVGRLTKDPESKNSSSDKVFCNFSIAVDREYKDNQGNKVADFIPCIAWGKTAELISTYFKKGSLIGISGRMESRSYDDNGTKRTLYNILVNNIDFIGGKVETKTEEPKNNQEEESKSFEPLYPVSNEPEEGLPFSI